MDNALLITDKSITLGIITDLMGSDLVFNYENDKVLTHSSDTSFLSVIDDGDELNRDYYDERELSFIHSKIKSPRTFVLDSNSFELFSILIGSLSNQIEVLIDNDYGKILSSDEVLSMTSFKELFR